MVRRRVGADEILYEEACAEAAEVAAAALPEVRRRTEELVGLTAPPIRVTIASKLPALWHYFRPTPALLGWFTGVTAVLTLAAMGIAALAGPGHWLFFIVAGYALLVLAWVFRRYYWTVSFAGAVLLTAGVEPRALPAFVMLAAAGMLARTMRGARCSWPFVGGLAFEWRGLVRPVALLHWPTPARPPEAERLCFPLASSSARVLYSLAHEYAHVALHLRGRAQPPVWLDEGLAFWVAEQLVGTPCWRPEGRACVSEPEPARDPRERFTGQDWYYRLMARYYWEVRALAEAGKLPEVLAASAQGLARLRPSVTVGAERPV